MTTVKALDDLPTVTESEADIATKADAATAYVRRFGFADERELLSMLGVGAMDRHRLFETSFFYSPPEHAKHDRSVQVAGSYGGARRDKREAREIRRGGYVPSAAVQRELLGTPWMSEKGCQLSIPPAYTHHIGEQLLAHLENEAAA